MRNSQNCTFSFDPMLESLKYSPVQKEVSFRNTTKQMTQAPYSGPRYVIIAIAFSCYKKIQNGKKIISLTMIFSSIRQIAFFSHKKIITPGL